MSREEVRIIHATIMEDLNAVEPVICGGYVLLTFEGPMFFFLCISHITLNTVSGGKKTMILTSYLRTSMQNQPKTSVNGRLGQAILAQGVCYQTRRSQTLNSPFFKFPVNFDVRRAHQIPRARYTMPC